MDRPEFDFDTPAGRRGTGSYKWDSAPEGVIPLWVADMDFRTAPAILEALHKRVDHGIFGYERVPQAWYQGLIGWMSRRHGWTIPREWIQYTTGVVPAVSAVIKAFTKPGDEVALITPAYNCFFSSIRNNGCTAAEVPLLDTPEGWRIDFKKLRETLTRPDVKVFIFCSPHNPVGRVWTQEELSLTARIARETGVFLVSDEIHGEFVLGDHPYIPLASLPETDIARTVTLTSPTKTFNLAGAGIAAIIAADEGVRQKIDRAINDNECCDVNVFGVTADIAAWEKGEPWLDALLAYLKGNLKAAKEYLEREVPGCRISKLEGTYLLWVDLRPLFGAELDDEALCELIMRKEKVWMNPGCHYGRDGQGFVRINLATQRSVLVEGLKRFAAGIRRELDSVTE